MSDRPEDIIDVALRVASALESVSGRYFAGGSLGSSRDGGHVSDRQWSDILGVLRAQGAGLDLDYMRRWATALAIDDLLARATEEFRRDSDSS